MSQRETDDHTGDQYQDHMNRLDAIKREFLAGRINVREKRQQIVNENNAYYRVATKSPVTGEWLTSMPAIHDSVAAIVADASGAPLEAARVALQRWRQLNHDAAYAETAEESRELFAEGQRAFYQILKTAIPKRT